VQILADKPRSIFYVAFISKVPFDPSRVNVDLNAKDEYEKAKLEYETMLRIAFQAAKHNKRGEFRDLLVERAQQDHAKAMRADLVGNLQRAFQFDPPTTESRKSFDERAGD